MRRPLGTFMHLSTHTRRARTQTSGIGEDSVFLGTMEVVPPSPQTARAWVAMNHGGILAVDAFFTDMFGYSDICGVPSECTCHLPFGPRETLAR